MLAPLLVTTLTLVAPPALRADTVIAVEAGTRISIRNFQGSITVSSWERNAVQLTAGEGDTQGTRIEHSARTLVIQALNFEGGDSDEIDLTVTVPATSPVDLQAPFADVTVEGVRASISVETVEGDLRIRGGEGVISLQTVEGDVVLEEAEGNVEVSTVDGDVELADVSGDITAATIDGDVRLEGIVSSEVKATTVDGDITFRGIVQADGLYRLSTHDGDLLVTVPEDTDATVSVETFEGEFISSFPVTLQGRVDKRRFQFILGSGAARLELKAFDGEIHLRSPGKTDENDL